MNRALKRLCGLLVVFFLCSATSNPRANQAPEQDHPLIGTWIQDVERSIYDPGPPPQSQTRTYARTPEGLKATVETVHADGTTSSFEYVATYEMFDPVIGARTVDDRTVDAIKLRRVRPNTDEAILRHAGREVGLLRRVVSEDGQLMTISLRLGEDYTSLRIFDKKKPESQ